MFFSFYMINAILPKSIFIWLPQGITIHSERDQNTNFHEYFPPNMTYSTSTPQSDAWYYIFVQNLRRHSFNEQSFSNNKRWRRFWINSEDLIFLGISNFQSQVGAITRETGGRLQGRRGTLGEGEEGTKMIIFTLSRIRFWGPDLRMGTHCWLSWGHQVPDRVAGSQAN